MAIRDQICNVLPRHTRIVGLFARHRLLLLVQQNSRLFDMLFLLTLLILLPMFSYWNASRGLSKYKFSIAGATFGAVVSPWAFGLYSWFFLSPFGVVLGFIGLALVTIPEYPGFQMAVSLGLVPKGEIVQGVQNWFIVEAINAVVWSTFYGLIGYLIDILMSWKRNKTRPHC